MEFRLSTETDLEFVSKHSLYEEENNQPTQLDHIFTLDHGDYILGIGGFRMITNSTAWAWVQLTEYVGRHIEPTYRVIKEYMEIFCKDHNICRLQAWVKKDFHEGIRTVRHLGFQEEYMMKDFLGKDKSAIMFVKYYDGEQ